MMEKFWCANCGQEMQLDVHGRCPCCGSSAVVSAERPSPPPPERGLTGIERMHQEGKL